ncbi:citrate lyase beta [Trichuris trichiura]|uniref:Citramalyl-CoA lyase, mitochondrial n=1 Tax=Trichuris trichiura TaxID=36087 RepID=A0A077Z010_TRITR|nr:citrate lyase beta [Trichuris trichiura]
MFLLRAAYAKCLSLSGRIPLVNSVSFACVYRRAMMYVPASDERKLAKLPELKADCVVLDCEDGVAINRKREARSNVAKLLSSADTKCGAKELGWRLNSVSSGLLEEDLREVGASGAIPQAVMLPKVNSVQDLSHAIKLIAQYMPYVKNPIPLIIWIESAKALIDAPNILAAGANCSSNSPLHLEAVVFGSDDFCADIGATRSKEANELLFARQYFVTVCKAYRLQAIDIVFIDFKDLTGLKKQCIEARNMGFTGKQVIHPTQVPIVQQAFVPSDEQVKWATELLEQFQKHEDLGKGAFTFRGEMIDMPLVLQAKQIVSCAEAK